jgi:DNA-binding NarL/FixJ family response regulator
MAYTESTRKTRAKARQAGQAVRRQRLEDARADLRSLKAFLAANRRLLEVDVWLDDRLVELHATAESRRTTHRQDAATALADMTARGMSVEEIARMAGMTAETVHNYLTRSA